MFAVRKIEPQRLCRTRIGQGRLALGADHKAQPRGCNPGVGTQDLPQPRARDQEPVLVTRVAELFCLLPLLLRDTGSEFVHCARIDVQSDTQDMDVAVTELRRDKRPVSD